MTETGLRLCAPNGEAAIAAVRALSEGRAPQRRLLTVPYTEFRAPVARARCAYEDLTPVRLRNTVVKTSHERNRQQISDFKATNPGKFTSHDLAVFADILPSAASNRLVHLANRGTVERMGKAGRNVVWRFV